MEQTKIIPLENALEAKFSPDGKHLVACEKKNIKVYDAHSGAVKGNLPNFPIQACKSAQSPLEYQFSPQSTYFYATFTDRVWKLADLTEHLPGLLAARLIKLWNAQETVFLSAPHSANPPQANIWHLHNTHDGTITHSIDHPDYGNGIPLSPRISANGKLLAFIYKTQNYFGQEVSKAVVTNLNYPVTFGVTFGFDEQEITDAHQVEFCPDNTHALISVSTNMIVVRNFKTRQQVINFICASKTRGYLNGNYRDSQTNNSCSITPQGLISTITNRLDPKEKYVITQNGHQFTCTKPTKPDREQIVTHSLSRNLTIIQKNKRTTYLGGKFYDIFLEKKDGVSTQETCLLTQIYKTPKNITFAGSHDEQVILIDPIKNILYIFDPYSGQELGKIEYRSFQMSPTTHAFIAKPKDKDEKNEQSKLYILPSAAQLLGKQQNSYFSVLPEDLRLQLRNYTT
jgi:hypothetical protein